MKLAIFTPGAVPVPAVKGGAIEQLVQYIIDENEIEHKYDIDLYTVDDAQLDNYVYKFTKLIRIKDKYAVSYFRLYYGITNRINKYFNTNKYKTYVTSKMVKLFKKNYYDAVLIENNMDLYSMLLKKKTKERFYFHLHNDFDCNDPSKTLAKAKIVAKTADKILVVSNFLKTKLHVNGIDNVKVIYNAVIKDKLKKIPTDEQIYIRKKYNITKKDFVIVFIGRFDQDKGVDKIIDALNILDKKKQLKNIKCLIVGHNFFHTNRENEYIELLEKKAKSIRKYLRFTGYIKNTNINEIYSIANSVIIPSQVEEVFGVVALEAMTSGCPIIASVSGALPEVLENNAIFIKRGNEFSRELAKDIIMLKNNKDLRSKLVKGEIKRACEFPQDAREYFSLISKEIK